jgi:hypothetical protein
MLLPGKFCALINKSINRFMVFIDQAYARLMDLFFHVKIWLQIEN